MSDKLNGTKLNSQEHRDLRSLDRSSIEHEADVIGHYTAVVLARAALDRFEAFWQAEWRQDPVEMPLTVWVERMRELLLTLQTDQMPELAQYTLFALDPSGRQAGDSLWVAGHHVDAAIKALEAAHEVEGLHFELYEGWFVRHANNWQPLPWMPGQAVTEPESEAVRHDPDRFYREVSERSDRFIRDMTE
jgi:hypothetical protein